MRNGLLAFVFILLNLVPELFGLSAGVEKEAGGIESQGYIERIGDAGYTYTLLDLSCAISAMIL